MLPIEAPFDSPVFLVVLAVHIVAGITCVITGIVAMLSKKRAGRHPQFGTAYYRALVVAFTTAAVLSAVRWAARRSERGGAAGSGCISAAWACPTSCC